jgi:hypothetical protein
MVAAHKDLKKKLAALERKYDKEFKIFFEAIAELMTPPEKPRRKIGFDIKEPRPAYGGKRKRTSHSK